MTDEDRLRRRHARERSARLQAERIAEQAIADLVAANERLDERIADRTEQLELTLARLEDADEVRAVFLRGAAHEMSTPLHAITGFLELIEGRAVDSEVKQAAKQAAVASRKLDNALRTLREFAALSGGGVSLQAESMVLGDVADRISDRWRLPVARMGNLLTIEVAPEPKTEIVVDRVRLFQIADSLLDNASRYARTSVEVVMTALDRSGARELQFVVSDDGPGIPSDFAQSAFEAFTTGPQSADGFGVGLTLARAAAELLGGTLDLEVGSGTTRFMARIPMPEVGSAEQA